MIECCKYNIVSYQTSVAKAHSAMILKITACIYEYILPDSNILSEISIKWRKNP